MLAWAFLHQSSKVFFFYYSIKKNQPSKKRIKLGVPSKISSQKKKVYKNSVLWCTLVIIGEADWKKIYPLSERRASLDFMGAQLIDKYDSALMGWGPLNCPPWCRETLVSRTAIRVISVVFPVGAFVFIIGKL